MAEIWFRTQPVATTTQRAELESQRERKGSMEKLNIPPEFSSYAEEKGIFTLYEGMLQALLTARPACPLQFLSHYLSVDRSKICHVVVYGPPCSGQHSVSKLIARRLRAVHVVPERVLKEDQSPAGNEARALVKEGKEVTPSLWATIIHSRTQQTDCQEKGWVLQGYPRSREQALVLQCKGVIATHFVHLTCPDTVLVERYGGKRIDPITGDIYHLVFSPPDSEAVAARLVEEEGGVTVNLHQPLELYHRQTHSVLSAYTGLHKTFDADQPIGDLVSQVHHFLCTRKRSLAPLTPRVVLLGPGGSGKSVQATKLAYRYDLIDVDCGELLRLEMVSGSPLADKMRPFIDSNIMIPDEMMLSLVTRRLSCLDCISRGWVLHGFPLTGHQAELLSQAGFTPNRYHLLMKPPRNQDILNRLTTHPQDTEESVSQSLEAHLEFCQELEDVYQWGQHVNADQDPLTVFELIESQLINPLPMLHPTSDK